jgi:hypothetical protein
MVATCFLGEPPLPAIFQSVHRRQLVTGGPVS